MTTGDKREYEHVYNRVNDLLVKKGQYSFLLKKMSTAPWPERGK